MDNEQEVFDLLEKARMQPAKHNVKQEVITAIMFLLFLVALVTFIFIAGCQG